MANHEPPPDLRLQLITAALAVLEGGGEVGLRAIARDVGVSAMAPYRHFKDKAALLAAVVRRGFEELHNELEGADAVADAGEAVVAQGEAYIAFARRHPALFQLMFGTHKGLPPEENTAYGVLVRRVRQLDPVSPEAAALACWSAVHGMAMLTLGWGTAPDTGLRERAALTLVVAGLSAGKRGR